MIKCFFLESEGDVGSKADASANVSPSAPSTGVVSTGAHVNLDKVTKLNLAQQVAFVYKPVLDCLKVRALDDTNEVAYLTIFTLYNSTFRNYSHHTNKQKKYL